MSDLCTVARSYDDDLACGRPAVALVTVACRHEHVTHDRVCDTCLARLRAQQMVCVACDRLPSGAHHCLSTLSGVEGDVGAGVHRETVSGPVGVPG